MKLGIKPIQDLFGCLFNACFETINRLLLTAGKEKSSASQDLANEIVDAQAFGVLLGCHGLAAFLAFLGCGVSFVMQCLFGGLRGCDSIFKFVRMGFR